jgi:hypothetical protein
VVLSAERDDELILSVKGIDPHARGIAALIRPPAASQSSTSSSCLVSRTAASRGALLRTLDQSRAGRSFAGPRSRACHRTESREGVDRVSRRAGRRGKSESPGVCGGRVRRRAHKKAGARGRL